MNRKDTGGGREVVLARPAIRAAHLVEGTSPRRGRWSPVPPLEEVTLNSPHPMPGFLGPRVIEPASEWALRWIDQGTRRLIYVLRADEGDAAAAVFDAAARFADALDEVRETLWDDALGRSRHARLARIAILVDQAHLLPGVETAAFRLEGDAQLMGVYERGLPSVDPFVLDSYLNDVLPGLTARAICFFRAATVALAVLRRLKAELKARPLSRADVLRLIGGFPIDDPDSAPNRVLRASRRLDYPEALFHRGTRKIHVAAGALGTVAASLGMAFPRWTALGASSIYSQFLAEMNLRVSRRAVHLPENIGVGPERTVALTRDRTAEEADANEWFWQQSSRPTEKEDNLLRALVNPLVVTMDRVINGDARGLRARRPLGAR